MIFLRKSPRTHHRRDGSGGRQSSSQWKQRKKGVGYAMGRPNEKNTEPPAPNDGGRHPNLQFIGPQIRAAAPLTPQTAQIRSSSVMKTPPQSCPNYL